MELRFLHIIICFFISASLIGQQQGVFPDERIISYTAVNKSLKKVLIDLSLKTSVNISFNERQINRFQSVTVVQRGTPLGKIINEALRYTDLEYKLIDKQIVISKRVKDATGRDVITLSGYVEDVKSSERLVNANIVLPEYKLGSISNEFGFFSLSIPKGEQRVNFSYLGYTSYELVAEFHKDTTLLIQLDPSHHLSEVLITDRITVLEIQGDSIVETKTTSSRELFETMSNREIESLVGIGGESDVYNLTQYKSGVNAGIDGFGGLYIRGGSKDQNLVLLDGIPIYNSDHALGIFSIFNSDVIKNAKLYKSGIPAHYEGRLSSVLDIRTKEGNKQEYETNLNLGLFTGKASFEGPIQKGKSSFILSLRRSYVDPWIDALADHIAKNSDNESETQYYFYDLNLKMNFELNKRNTFYVSFYRGRDAFFRNSLSGDAEILNQTSENVVDWDWGNELFVTGLNSQISNKAFLNASLYLNRYDFKSLDLDRYREFNGEPEFKSEEYSFGLFNSNIRDIGAKINIDYRPSNKHYIKTGLSYIDHNFSPGLLFYSTFVTNELLFPPNSEITKSLLDTQLDELNIHGSELNFYLEDEITPNNDLRINLGILNALILTEDKAYIRPQPRISIDNRFGKINAFMAVGWISQYIQALTNSGLGFPADLWLPSTNKLAPQSSFNTNLGLRANLKEFEVKTEVYYRKLSNVVAFNEGGIFNISQDVNNWEDQIPKGSGEAYGWEFELKKVMGKSNWFLNYTLAKSTRQFEGVNQGLSFPARYDRRHSFKLAWFYRINNNLNFTANWVYASGNKVTLPTGFVEVPLPDQTVDLRLIYEEKNNYTLSAYHKLDVSLDYNKQTSWGEHRFRFGVTNIYNRKNPFYIDIVRDLDHAFKYTTKEFTLFPIMPSISYGVSF